MYYTVKYRIEYTRYENGDKEDFESELEADNFGQLVEKLAKDCEEYVGNLNIEEAWWDGEIKLDGIWKDNLWSAVECSLFNKVLENNDWRIKHG